MAQLYVSGGPDQEIRSLNVFQSIHRKAAEGREVRFTLTHDHVAQPKLEVSVGGGQPVSGS